MEKNARLGQAFEIAIAAEKAAKALYQGLELKFADQTNVASLWRNYARNEAEHVQWLTVLRNKLPPEKLSHPVDAAMMDALRVVARFSAEPALNGVENLEDALQLVSELENGETNAITRFLIHHFEPDEQLREFLESQLIKHIGQSLLTLPV